MRALACALAAVLSYFVLEATTLPKHSLLDQVFDRIYNQDTRNAKTLAEHHIQAHPSDLDGHLALAASLYFGEMMRTGVIVVDGGQGDRKTAAKADPAARADMLREFRLVEEGAAAVVGASVNEPHALLTLMMLHGLERDYLALVEKQYRASWKHAEEAQRYALALLATDPNEKDAFFTLGFNEYIRQSSPFFLRPMMTLTGGSGDKDEAIRSIEMAARDGRLLNGFARLILIGVYQKQERKPDLANTVCSLRRSYPENPAIRSLAESLHLPGCD